MSGRICTKEGCDRPARGRGMCAGHYSAWRTAHPGLTIMETNRQAILDAMPGTVRQLVDRTGLDRCTVRKHLAVLNVTGKERQAYIASWIPTAKQGDNWQEVYYQGAKPNKKLTKREKHRHYLNLLNAKRHAARGPDAVPGPIRKPLADPPPRASWFDALPCAA